MLTNRFHQFKIIAVNRQGQEIEVRSAHGRIEVANEQKAMKERHGRRIKHFLVQNQTTGKWPLY